MEEVGSFKNVLSSETEHNENKRYEEEWSSLNRVKNEEWEHCMKLS